MISDTLNPDRKPRDDEIDVWGITHRGHKRPENQDHFLLASLHKRIEVHRTSLPSSHELQHGDERIAFLAMVADGVGGGSHGEEASRIALEQATSYVTRSTQCYYDSDPQGDTFVDLLQRVATHTHEKVVARSAEQTSGRGMATTLTLWIGVWPWFYLLQVGDSRYYLFRDNTLTQVSRDQTMAQDLVDQGVLTRSAMFRSPLASVLSSAIGGTTTVPVVTRIRSEWNIVHLLCSDGLTKHVSDEQIAARLRTMRTAKETCEALLQDALDDGGSDNITIIVGRAVPRSRSNLAFPTT